MGDMGDYWRDVRPIMKAQSHERKTRNMKSSRQALVDAGITFHSCNNGVHLQIKHKTVEADLWPSTGLWQIRKPESRKGRGVFKLLKCIKQLTQ